MTDTFREICWGVIQGFRDAVLGTLHVFKLDADRKSEVKQQDVPLTTLAKRRAEKQSKGQKEKEKAKDRYLTVAEAIRMTVVPMGTRQLTDKTSHRHGF